MMYRCPHCRQETELFLEAPAQEPLVPRKVMFWTAVTVVVLVGGLILALAGLKQLEKRAAERKQQGIATGQGGSNRAADGGAKSGKP
jgi:hypothetical protein